ncbi:GTP-binding protein Di-Ras1 [Trichonephila clavata]|uniref:GTP-binding protein Di-Ras1 n=1 Tax=Trichonephila clavata TaxID=2740835 RepID=A0A8X6J7T6_TRICU|nr:GTP-binding protein Di-Ras1 [Trichonephila clavata]
MVGNKCDLETHRQVSKEMAEKQVNESMEGCEFFEASAKFDTNVKEVFLQLLQMARTQEEAQEALLEEQDLYRRKSRRLSKRLSRKLSCFNNMAFALKKNPSPTRSEPQPQETLVTSKGSSSRNYKDNQKCVLI